MLLSSGLEVKKAFAAIEIIQELGARTVYKTTSASLRSFRSLATLLAMLDDLVPYLVARFVWQELEFQQVSHGCGTITHVAVGSISRSCEDDRSGNVNPRCQASIRCLGIHRIFRWSRRDSKRSRVVSFSCSHVRSFFGRRKAPRCQKKHGHFVCCDGRRYAYMYMYMACA
jgi:hypothetical protein